MQGLIVDVRTTARGFAPRVPFKKLARELLPPPYQLSLVLCGDSLSKRMNKAYRKKNYAPNVLSFPYGKNEGEIFINLKKAAKEAGALGITPRDRIAHLFIHGCLHLRNWKHGDRMDRQEWATLRKFGFTTIVP